MTHIETFVDTVHMDEFKINEKSSNNHKALKILFDLISYIQFFYIQLNVYKKSK